MTLTKKKNKIPRHPSEMLGGDNPQSGVLAGAGPPTSSALAEEEADAQGSQGQLSCSLKDPDLLASQFPQRGQDCLPGWRLNSIPLSAPSREKSLRQRAKTSQGPPAHGRFSHASGTPCARQPGDPRLLAL